MRVGPSSAVGSISTTMRSGEAASGTRAATSTDSAPPSSVDHWRRARSTACAVMRRPSSRTGAGGSAGIGGGLRQWPRGGSSGDSTICTTMPSASLGCRTPPSSAAGRVFADDAVTKRGGARAGLAQARHLERHVVDAGAARGEKAVQEAVVAARLEDLDAPPPSNSHWPKRKTSADIPKEGAPPSTPIRYGGASAMRGTAMAIVIELDPGH